MRVLVDATVVHSQLGGIGTSIAELVDHLTLRPELEVSVVTQAPERFTTRANVIEAPAKLRRFATRVAWREAHLRRLVRSTRSAVVLASVPELTLAPLPVPEVMVVHDIHAVVAPAYHSLARYLRFRLDLVRTCGRAAHIICCSNATLTSLHGIVRLDLDRASVVHWGPPRRETRGVTPAETMEPFILYPGEFRRHKNVETLLAAYATPGAERLPKLILTGPRNDKDARSVQRLLEADGLHPRVDDRGWVSRGELEGLYSAAHAVVFPSLLEGFGLPVLEAMDRGCLVLASDIPSIREVAGDAALLVNAPLDPLVWRDAIVELQSMGEAARREMIDRGRERARRYSWERAAARTAEILTSVGR